MEKELTFVYICRSGENEELRYSIRSVLKFFPDAKIWVVGEPPEWYDGDYIKVKQDSSKYNNAQKNLQAIAASNLIPQSFVMMNDDFYIMKEIEDIENFHEGLLEEKHNIYFDAYQSSTYTRKLGDTKAKLKRLGHDQPLSYELHVPFLVEKWKLARVARYEGVLWRSMYGNIFQVGGAYMEDVKVYSTTKMNFKSYNYKLGKSPFLSTEDRSFDEVLNKVLKKKFPAKSALEKY